jgi:hypothetical protein
MATVGSERPADMRGLPTAFWPKLHRGCGIPAMENFILTPPRFSEKRLLPRFGGATAFLLVFTAES